MAIEKITFKSCGLKCAADLFLPDKRKAKYAAVVMGAGFNSIREGLISNAMYLTKAGYAALTVDYRHFGESEGEPRGQLFPLDEVEDYRNAVSYLQTRQDINADRIGIWGVSFGGGIVLQVAAFDRRIRAVVSQSPIVSGFKWMRGLRTAEQWEVLLRKLEEDRRERYNSEKVALIPSTGVGSKGDFAAMPGDEELVRYVAERKKLPSYRSEINLDSITLESMEKIIEFMPDKFVEFVEPRPLLIIANGGHNTFDIVHPLDQIQDVFRKAGEPKRMIVLPYRERGLYSEPGMGEAMCHAINFYKEFMPPE
jgi:uncharacterized protein